VAFSGGRGVTVNVKVVGVVVTPRGLAVTSTWNEPFGVVKVVEMTNTLEAPTKEGVTDDGSNEHEAPGGREEATQNKATASALPLVNAAVTTLLTDPPRCTVILPEFDSEKSNREGAAIMILTTIPGDVSVQKYA
jgi:hypothetical protein